MSVDVIEKSETIKLSETAARVVKDLLGQKNVPDHGLRVFVSGGGCSGLQYGMALEAEARPYDHVVEAYGVKMFVDPTSMLYLSSATIDYEDSLMGGGFRVDNPHAVSTCGCGHSFKTEAQAGAAPAAGNGEGGACCS
jgi:iron-sulfur cluster assembly protein